MIAKNRKIRLILGIIIFNKYIGRLHKTINAIKQMITADIIDRTGSQSIIV
jgi:hypothetical protein